MYSLWNTWLCSIKLYHTTAKLTSNTWHQRTYWHPVQTCWVICYGSFDVFDLIVTMFTWLFVAQLKALLLIGFYHHFNRVIVARGFGLISLKSNVHQIKSRFFKCHWIRKHPSGSVRNTVECCYNKVNILWYIHKRPSNWANLDSHLWCKWTMKCNSP